MALTPSAVNRTPDIGGQDIRTFQDAGGAQIQAVGITDELGNQTGIASNPLDVQVTNALLTTLVQDIDILTRLLANSPLIRAAITSSYGLHVNVDNNVTVTSLGGQTALSGINGPTSGAPTNGSSLNYLPVYQGPVDQRFEMMQRANQEFQGIRGRMTIS